jgi:hypothetical protein
MRANRTLPVLCAAWCLTAVPAARPGEDWVAPKGERERANPVAVSPEALAKGRLLYQKHCVSCHGERGKGDGPAAGFGAVSPQDLTAPTLQSRLSDGEIFWKITNGRTQDDEIVMPALLGKVPAEADRWKLVLFVRSLATLPR